MDADVAKLKHSNNKCYDSAFRYIYIYIYREREREREREIVLLLMNSMLISVLM